MTPAARSRAAPPRLVSVRIGFFGGLRVEQHGRPIPLAGAMQLAVFFRLAMDAGRAVSYRSIVEDAWSQDAPENARAALQSVVSRLRSQLPDGAIESQPGGYRLAAARADVDILAFEDLVAAASAARGDEATRLASQALALWTGEPWIPSQNFDWVEADLHRDRAAALALGGVAGAPAAARPNLPVPLTPLVGRQAELELIDRQLAAHRLVTIVGTGGAGKTRLAVETALAAPAALLVELAPVGPDELLGAVLAATGRELLTETLAERGSQRDRLLDALAGREVLVVLDNCEHVIVQAARLAEDLLGALPGLRILATSREPLAIAGEAIVAVGSLAHPSDHEAEGLLDYPAVELFRQRARAARGRDLDQDELPAAAQVCARLDGLPLAIELAAARLRTLGLDEVLAGLEDRFTLLTGGSRTALPRHQTLRAMIDWSWSLLDPQERAALAGLAVFPAGVDARDAAALATAMGLPAASVFDSLVDKSLLQRTRGRYRALETIREYGIERLTESGGTAAARAAQAAFERDRARENDRLLRGPRIGEAIGWFDAEEDNISAALRHALAQPLPEIAVDLAAACLWYWVIRDRQADARSWLPLILPLAAQVDSDESRMMRLVEPVITAFSGRAAESADPNEILERAAGLMVPLAAIPVAAGMHDLLQVIPPLVGAFADVIGEPDWRIAVRVPRGQDFGLDPWPVAFLHVVRAAMAQNRGDVRELGEESELAYRLFTEIGDLWGLALSSQMRAEWLLVNGRPEEALEISDLATRNLRPITSSWDLAQQQGQAVVALVRLGRIDEARERVGEVVAEARAGGSPRALFQALTSATFVDLEARDLPAVERRIAEIDWLVETGPLSNPPQVDALVAVIRARTLLLQGEPDAAEPHLRAAAAAAFASHDQPVIGLVAVNLGTCALARGDIHRALRAVDLATSLIGAFDATNPQIIEIERAAEDAGIGRAAHERLTRPKALEALQDLVSAT